MRLSDILYDSEYSILSDREVMDVQIDGITSRSDEVRDGFAFVSLRGTNTDGAEFVAESVRRGARLIVSETPPAICDVPYVLVRNARRALSYMLHRFWGRAGERMRLYAVTGTNGKTSTCMYLREIFMEAGIRTGYIGTLKSMIDRERIYLGGNDDDRMSTMTTPDPEQLYRILYEMEAQNVESVIIECSSHALYYDKLAPLRFRCGVFTNFSPEHLDFHSDMSSYLSAKLKLCPMSDKMLLNGDDPVCDGVKNTSDIPCRTFGTSVEAYYRASDIELNGVEGVEYNCRVGRDTVHVKCNVPGRFSLYNSLAALSTAANEGIPNDAITRGIFGVERIDGRIEKLDLTGKLDGVTVVIDYAHTERALEQLLISVCECKGDGGRIVTLFGCGGNRDRSKRAPMGAVASKYSDLVIITEDNSRDEALDSIIADIMTGIDRKKDHRIIKNRKEALEYVIKNAIKGDIILLVGKGHENYQIKNGKRIPFSEKQVIFELLGKGDTEV